ncbi:MAG: hypothetical protein K0U41_04720 [Gammaproteobacteria bacterium]|nr:hypothetical protein [Gammaproteobacteria bacterium]
MKEAYAVTGYVRNEIAESLGKKKYKETYIDVYPDLSVPEVFSQIRFQDVEESRVGSTKGDSTLVQLILRDGVDIQTTITTSLTVNEFGLKRINDPVLNQVRIEAVAKKIMV